MRWKLSNLNLEETVDWIMTHDKGLVFCCTLNELALAKDDAVFEKKLRSGDLLTTDGMPLVWLNRLKTGKGSRVYGPELMEKILGHVIARPKVAAIPTRLLRRQKAPRNDVLKNIFVGDEKNRKFFLKHGDYVVMPMKENFDKKDYDDLYEAVERSDAEVVWLGLGAKKQVEVGYELKKRDVKKVMITVGAAFDFLSGNIKQSPRWLRNAGGEWLYRLGTEPKRLWGRYVKIIGFLAKGGLN